MNDLATPSADDATKSAPSPAEALIAEVDKTQPDAKEPDPKAEGDKDKAKDGEPAAAPAEGEQGDEGKSKNKVTAKDRINQLTAEKHSALRRAEAAEAKLRSLEQGLQPPPPTASEEEQEEFRLRKVMRTERADEARRDAEEAAAQASRAIFDTFEAKARAAEDRFPGLVDKFLALPVVSRETADFLSESDVAPELAHYFVSNPGEAERIARLSTFEQGKALARLEANVTKPAKKPSNAPQPPPSTPGNPGANAKGTEDMSVEDLSKWYANRGKRG